MADRNFTSESKALHQQINEFVMEMIVDLSRGKLPTVSIAKYQARLRFLPEECSFGIYERSAHLEQLSFQHTSSLRRLVIMLRVLAIIQQLLQDGKHASKRDIYYSDPSIFHGMPVVDQAINDICVRFKCSRNSLHVVAVSKGLVMGWLSYVDNDRKVDCMRYSCTGVTIPVHMHHVREIRSLAEYILLVEKETVFQRLADDGFCFNNRCIIVTGKGYPDVATRSFVQILVETLNLPVYGLVDCDPHGVDILLTYKFGSLSMAYDAATLATPGVFWIGVFLSDCETFGLTENCLLPLTNRDKQKAAAILERNYVKHIVPSWRNQVEIMLREGVKLEIEAMATISLSFLSEVFLPSKVKTRAYL